MQMAEVEAGLCNVQRFRLELFNSVNNRCLQQVQLARHRRFESAVNACTLHCMPLQGRPSHTRGFTVAFKA